MLRMTGPFQVGLLIALSLLHDTHAVYVLPPLVSDRNSSAVSIVPCCYQQIGLVKKLGGGGEITQ